MKKYIAKDNNEVYIGKKIVARMYFRHDGEPELRIIQGMPRDETIQKLLSDCPDFCKHNSITSSTYPFLFSEKVQSTRAAKVKSKSFEM